MTAMVTEHDERAERTKRLKRTMERVIPQLGGLQYAFVWADKRSAERAVIQLTTCREHNGIHHFAVIAEGKGVAFSEAGRACLVSASILPAMLPVDPADAVARSAEQGEEQTP